MSPAHATGPLILVVEDDVQVRRVLVTSLLGEGHRMLEAADGTTALKLASRYVPDLVLLDLGLPDIEGVEVARRIRTWSAVPIVVLSARGQEAEKVAAFDVGVDDYVTKPFGFLELLARIRAGIRHSTRPVGAGPDPVFVSGGFRLDFEHRRVTVNGRAVSLTPTEYKLVTVLVRHAGRVVTHANLLREVWGPRSPEQIQYLRVYMTRLRRKLEADPLRPRLLATEPGIGYRLHASEP